MFGGLCFFCGRETAGRGAWRRIGRHEDTPVPRKYHFPKVCVWLAGGASEVRDDFGPVDDDARVGFGVSIADVDDHEAEMRARAVPFPYWRVVADDLHAVN